MKLGAVAPAAARMDEIGSSAQRMPPVLCLAASRGQGQRAAEQAVGAAAEAAVGAAAEAWTHSIASFNWPMQQHTALSRRMQQH